MGTNNEIKNKGLNSFFLFLERYWLYILIIIALICMVVSMQKCKAEQKLKSDMDAVNKFQDSSYTSEIKKWKDAYQKEHTRAENLTVDKVAMQIVSDSVARLLKIKPKQVTAISLTGTELAITVKPKVDTTGWLKIVCPEGDTITIARTLDLDWSNTWMSITGHISDTGSIITITGKDTIKRTDYWDRKHWYSKKTWYSDFNISNPNINVTGYKGIELKEARKKWGVGIGIQYGYPLNDIKLSKPVVHVGIGLQYSMLTF